MNRLELFGEIKRKKSFLCIGLDTDLDKIPGHLMDTSDPIFEFNKIIIDATHQYCVAYKPNVAFYEALGAKGWVSLQKTLDYIPKGIFKIADAKRADIGNTSALYAKAFFKTLNVDALTVSPYMGADSIRPFFEFDGKWVILLLHTSNSGSQDFQTLEVSGGKKLYEEILEKAMTWATAESLMFVVGATYPKKIEHIRKLAPDYFFLVPGYGKQGGSLDEIAHLGMNSQCGLLVNSSRNILYNSKGSDFGSEAAKVAESIRNQMKTYLEIGELIQ